MFSRAAITMAAGANFIVERTVDFVLLRAKNGGEVVGHDQGLVAGIGGMLGCNFYPNVAVSDHS